MKPIKLTPKEISRADYSRGDGGFTIVTRPQEDGGYWVAAISVSSGLPIGGIGGKLAQMTVPDRSGIPNAIREVNRDLDKFLGYSTNMTERSRYQHNASILRKILASEGLI